MSRQRTIWEKTSTLWPPANSFGSSLSISTSLPAAWIMACSWKSTAFGLWHFLKLSKIFSSAPEGTQTQTFLKKQLVINSQTFTVWANVRSPRKTGMEMNEGEEISLVISGSSTRVTRPFGTSEDVTMEFSLSFKLIRQMANLGYSRHWSVSGSCFKTDSDTFKVHSSQSSQKFAQFSIVCRVWRALGLFRGANLGSVEKKLKEKEQIKYLWDDDLTSFVNPIGG